MKNTQSDRQLMENIIAGKQIDENIQLLINKKQALIHRLIQRIDPSHKLETEDLVQYGNEMVLQSIQNMQSNHTNPEAASRYFNSHLNYEFHQLAKENQRINSIPVSNLKLEKSNLNDYLANQYSLAPIERHELQSLLGQALNDDSITKREFDLIVYYYGTRNDDPHTIPETCEYMDQVQPIVFKYTEKRIRQILNRCIRKLKRYDHTDNNDCLFEYLKNREYLPNKNLE